MMLAYHLLEPIGSLVLLQYGLGMAQLLFMKPLIMLWPIACPSDQVSGTYSLGSMLQQALHFVLGFTFNLHWLWMSN